MSESNELMLFTDTNWPAPTQNKQLNHVYTRDDIFELFSETSHSIEPLGWQVLSILSCV